MVGIVGNPLPPDTEHVPPTEKLNVNVHSITEQIKIDKILSSIETKEKLENEYLHNITKLKTHLLQNMFI